MKPASREWLAAYDRQQFESAKLFDRLKHETTECYRIAKHWRQSQELIAEQRREQQQAAQRYEQQRKAQNAGGKPNSAANSGSRSTANPSSLAQLRKEATQLREFASDPAGVVVRSAIRQVEGRIGEAPFAHDELEATPPLDRSTQIVFDQAQKALENSRANALAQHVAQASLKELEDRDRMLLAELSSFNSSASGISASPTTSPASGTRSQTLQVSESFADTTSSFTYRDAATGKSLLVGAGQILYRSERGGTLRVAQYADIGTEGDDPVSGQCSQHGVGRVVPSCESERAARSQR